MITIDAAAPNSAPNSDTAGRQKAWRDEIHTPEADYNANVPVDAIERDPANRVPTMEAVETLAKAIEAVGLLQPIVLLALGGGKYRVIAGEHRWSAVTMLGRRTIAARIYKSADDLAAARMALLENSAREGLTPIERARRFKQLEGLGMEQKAIGELAGGLSQPVVANAMRLLELPADVQTLVNEGALSEAHGVSLVRFAAWPRVCAAMAVQIVARKDSSKSFAERDLPYSYELRKAGLIVDINTGDTWSGKPVYTLPKHFTAKLGFIESYGSTYYLLPERAEDNIWASEQRSQDEARATRAAAQAKREAAKTAKAGGQTEEQKERRAKLEKNKKTLAENAAAYAAAVDKLKRTPSPSALLVAILCEAAVAGGFSAKRILAAADLIGVKLPKGLAEEGGGQGMRDVELMRKMDVMDLTRVALAVILGKQLDDANKNAWGMPANIELVMNAAVPPAKSGAAAVGVDQLLAEVPVKAKAKKKGGRVAIDDDIRCEVKRRVEAGQTGAEISKMLGISLPSVQNIKKALGLVRAQQGSK